MWAMEALCEAGGNVQWAEESEEREDKQSFFFGL